MLKNKFLYVLASFLISAIFLFFQRITGPTYPIRGSINTKDSLIKFKFLRSCTLGEDCKIIFNGKIDGYILYKKYKVDEKYTKIDFNFDGKISYVNLKLNLPKASKIEYDVFVKKLNDYIKINDKPIVLRFKGYVPSYILIPHIIFMYLFFFITTYIFLRINLTNQIDKKLFYISLSFLIFGGFIFGPFVQYYAFDVFWSGFPFGYDLTDNKTLLTLLVYFLPLHSMIKNKNIKMNFNIAYLLTTIVYLIPHSMYGSEYKFK
jgi:hypothetical protein